MLYLKEGFPEVDEVVKCTVKRIYGNTVFVQLDEYDKEALLIVSEIASGRIRNIRDYVVENKGIVCKVIRVIEKKKQIDVSLRRVSVMAMKQKLDQLKKEEFAEKVYEEVSEKLNITKDDLFLKTYEYIFQNYETVFDMLYEAMLDSSVLNNFKLLKKNEQKVFCEVINEKIKPEQFVLKEKITLHSLEADGVARVQKLISEAIKKTGWDRLGVTYVSAGKYNVKIEHDSLKEADKILETFLEEIHKRSKEQKVFCTAEK